jgi:hypothetical protein
MNLPVDYDGAWKEALEEFFQPFLELCFQRIAAHVDWSRGFDFLDQELQEVVRDAELGKMRADKLVKVYRLDGVEEWILIHVEVQSQTDKDLPWRMYQYFHRISDRHGKPVVSLAVLADEQVSWRPNAYETELWGCRLRFEYLVCKLLDYAQTPEIIEASPNPMAVVIAAHLASQATRNDPEPRFNLKWQLTRKLYEKGYAKQEVLNLYRLIDWVMVMPAEMELAFERKMLVYEEENRMPHITSIERIGIEKGLQLGRQEGRQEGQASLIVRLLRRRWGALPPELETRLSTMSLTQLERMSDCLLDFRDLAALQQWLDETCCMH